VAPRSWALNDPWDPRDPENRDRSRALRAELRRYLLNGWDPIGVADAPEAQDEYDGYLSPLLRLLHDGATEGEVRSYLLIVLDRMGLQPIGQREEEVANELCRWWQERTA
jgi:hypothetical protein